MAFRNGFWNGGRNFDIIDANRNATRLQHPNRINDIPHSLVRPGLVDGDEMEPGANFKFLIPLTQESQMVT